MYTNFQTQSISNKKVCEKIFVFETPLNKNCWGKYFRNIRSVNIVILSNIKINLVVDIQQYFIHSRLTLPSITSIAHPRPVWSSCSGPQLRPWEHSPHQLTRQFLRPFRVGVAAHGHAGICIFLWRSWGNWCRSYCILVSLCLMT